MAATAQQQQQQQSEVELLRSDLRRKDADLRLATSALLAIHNGTKLQDLVEVNLALEEQVKSLKKMVQMMQQQQPHERDDAAAATQRDSVRRNTTATISVRASGESKEPVHGDDSVKDSDLAHSRRNVPIATEADIQGLLSKLSTKELQLDVLRERCAGWEQQVIDLKFELQSLKDAIKEKDERERKEHEVLARQEQEDRADNAAVSSETALLSPVASPRAPNPDLAYLKNLALIRGKYWLQAEERANVLKQELTAAKAANEALRRDVAIAEKSKRALEEQAAKALSLEAQLCGKERELLETRCKLERLQQRHEEESVQFKIERRRSCRIMQELRGELNIQLMQLEKLYNLPKPPSPRKPAMAPVPRRPVLQRSASSGKAESRRSKSFIKFQAAA